MEAVLETNVPSASSHDAKQTMHTKFMNRRIKVGYQVYRVFKEAEIVKGFGSVIAQRNPVHTDLPFAGVNVLLTVSQTSHCIRV